MSEADHRARLQRIFAEAISLRNNGELEEALDALDRFDEAANGTSVGGDVVRGGILWNLGRIDEGAAAMRRVLALKDRHALASSVLVHCLLEGGRLDDARTEALRYLEFVDSGRAERAPKSLKTFYREIRAASQPELEAMARSLRDEKKNG
jgi:predicted Zn-dependent protease